ncbi:MAG: 2OG-Fe(II) oxygenase [Gammaproteobacteria bacterium]|nr:2OG-Fe(II) oxygenase [Gammaproteobacteria bacterium]NNK32481.1 2OG-Fe(II) oxygenase [Xanthomonadales bacterium]
MAAPLKLADCLGAGILGSTGDFARRFMSARPFRHVAIDDFLAPDFCGELAAHFPRFEDEHALNEDGGVGGKATRPGVRELGPAYRRLDDLVRQDAFRDWVGQVTGIDDLQYDPQYFGGGTHENLHGQELDPHVDFNYHPISRQHRRLNLIIYLNEEWEDEWGGSLQLHRDPHIEPGRDEIVTLTPLMNRCVIFETTERSWHGFRRIDLPAARRSLSRRSFALYFYTKTRPAEETGAEHSTIYVERHLPEHLHPGRVLSETDLEEIKNLLHRRDQHLQRLYRDVSDLMEKLNQPLQKATIRALRRRIHEFESSTSWKVTKPLRAVKRLFAPPKNDPDRKA